jgi:hypothetical protein
MGIYSIVSPAYKQVNITIIIFLLSSYLSIYVLRYPVLLYVTSIKMLCISTILTILLLLRVLLGYRLLPYLRSILEFNCYVQKR